MSPTNSQKSFFSRKTFKFSLLFLVLGSAFFGAALFLSNQGEYPPDFSYLNDLQEFHGPHIDTNLSSSDYASVERAWRQRRSGRGSNTSTVSSTTQTVTPTVTTSPLPTTVTNSPTTTTSGSSTATTTPTVLPSDSQATSTTTSVLVPPATTQALRTFGIAAGGGLTSLSQQDLQKYFQALSDLGVQWVRWDISWAQVQPGGPTNYDWIATDRVAAMAQQFGIKSLGILGYSPGWASVAGCVSGAQCAPANIQAFVDFTSIAASRYAGSINYWEVWNEPNIPGFWSPRPNVAQYTALLKASYVAIKKSNPNAFVILGGLSAAGDSPDGSIAPLTFVQGLYANGARGAFDALALHPYSYPASPDYLASWNSWQQMQQVRDTLALNGDGSKKIWITEYGAPTNGSGTPHAVNELKFTYGLDYMSEAAQQELAAQILNDYKQMSDWTGPVFWYSLHDLSTNLNTPENFFGILRFDWSKKPVYDTIRNFILGN